MLKHEFFGEFDLMVLLTIHRLKDDAYGVSLARAMGVLAGRSVSVGSVYAALEKLEAKELVTSRLGEASPERGGRAKRYFNLTGKGIRAIVETRALLNELWSDFPAAQGESA
ncbi:MAG TPA: PadR family transcriptional regulator [Terriglobus sp.]